MGTQQQQPCPGLPGLERVKAAQHILRDRHGDLAAAGIRL
jgi:hypothetical protein